VQVELDDAKLINQEASSQQYSKYHYVYGRGFVSQAKLKASDPHRMRYELQLGLDLCGKLT
jgi:hypothetical protein